MSTKPRLVVLASAEEAGASIYLGREARPHAHARHPCEHCRCCACHKLCTKCRQNCRPMEGSFIPVVYCPDFGDIRDIPPLRYLYRSDYQCEYRLRLPGTR